MPLISVVTAAYAPSAKYLAETIASVLGQETPDGWEIEHLIQEDGGSPRLREQVEALDERIAYDSNDAQLGVAITRNIALTRARGEIVQLIDHDDLLLPGAFMRMVPKFLELPVHWAIGQADDLLTDGSRRAYPPALPFGLVDRGVVNEWAIRHDGNWPLHCAAMMARTNTLRALGGWAASPSDDDIALFAAVFDLTIGYQEEKLTWLYRQHENQAHRGAQWRKFSRDGRQFAVQRVHALRALGLSVNSTIEISAPVNYFPAASIKD